MTFMALQAYAGMSLEEVAGNLGMAVKEARKVQSRFAIRAGARRVPAETEIARARETVALRLQAAAAV
jgi:hypothetical protein